MLNRSFALKVAVTLATIAASGASRADARKFHSFDTGVRYEGSEFRLVDSEEDGQVRAYLEVSFRDPLDHRDPRQRMSPETKLVPAPGVSFDAAASQIIVVSDGKKTVCATVIDESNCFGMTRVIRTTGKCKVESRLDGKHVVLDFITE